ncbi:AMP-binding protein, partial [Mucilaginibacter sp. RCC_168]|uniref:AMP-binding protein n=1 Tax=Mucilaginibacter sp. RCC_168 TaxID=3239221 RepID=UPI003524D534
DIEMSYAELNIRSNQLGHYLLRRYQMKKDDLIGIIADRSEWMIVLILGILKSGGGYVPVDPEYPEDRQRYMLEDSAVRCVLTIGSEGHTAPSGITCLDVQGAWNGEIAMEPAEDLGALCQPEDTAYVIYTSGSTGHPKGVIVEHRNVVSLMVNSQSRFKFTTQDIWLMAHSCVFDFSVWEMYGALLYGGQLVVPNWSTLKDIGKLYELIDKHKITVLNQTPSAFYSFLAQNSTSQASLELNQDIMQAFTSVVKFSLMEQNSTCLRLIIFGGEALHMYRLKPWISRFPLDSIRLINMYGITEITVHASYYELKAADILSEEHFGSIIGRGLDGIQVYVLDTNRCLCPVGVSGELYIGGSG